MRIVRFAHPAGMSFGVLDGDGQVAQIEGHPFGQISFTGQRFAAADVRLLSPILPSKVVAVGKNYADHVQEMGTGDAPKEPLIFLKPNTSVVGPGDPIVYPAATSDLQHEGELAVVIGRICRSVPLDRVREVIFGYTVANDVTARDLQKKDGQWARAKGYDTFCPLGPWITTHQSLEEVADLRIRTTLDGEERQNGSTNLMVFSVPELVEYISSYTTLLPGDVILTGTPAGVGEMLPGQEVSIEIEGIGTLTNTVAGAAATESSE